MSNRISTPFPLFTDIDGSPLNAGFLYLGESGKEPEANPVSVYWDKEKTILADQPIRTRNGYIVKDGKPNTIFIDSNEYSVLVKNSKHYLLYKHLSFEQFSSNSFVVEQVEIEKQRAIQAETILQTDLSNEIARATAVEQSLQLQISTSNAGIKYFSTEAELLAFIPTETDQKQAYAFDTKKNYLWQLRSGSTTEYEWKDEGVSLLDLSKTYTDEQSNLAVQKSVHQTLSQLSGLAKSDDTVKIAVLTDSIGRILLGYDTEKDTGIYAGMLEQVVDIIPGLKIYNDGRYLGLLSDSNNEILFGYDMLNDLPIIAGIEELIAGLELPNQKPLVAEVNHFVFHGQSLCVGATATTILSTSQPYFNTTFSKGPRLDPLGSGETLGVIPLVEQFNNPASDGGTNRGETPCSGAANYASRAIMLENGIDPQKHVIFASTAGHGGYRIDQLEKGTAWYEFLLHHVSEAKRINAGKTYKVQAIAWVQGENDAITGTQTPYNVYREKLEKLQSDANADIKAITGQNDGVKFITYQLSYAARTWSDQALVQLHLAQESDYFALSTPMYHMPYTVDNIHLTNVGYKWMGAYFGRAYKQLIVDNRKPDFINPKSAQIINDEIHVKFDVPKLPLVLDTTTLAITTDHGFKVLVDNVAATISSITANNNIVILKLSSVPNGVVKVRYALDYLGAGLTITGGASGNLRDSTTDSVVIAGVEKPLYHVCPHFELTAFVDKGI